MSLRHLLGRLVRAVWPSLFAGLLLCAASAAQAHKPSDSYLSLTAKPEYVQLQWDIALRDLDYAIGLDGDDDGVLTWDEVRAKHLAIAAYAKARLRASANGKDCPLEVNEHMLEQHSDGTYAVLLGKLQCPQVRSLTLNYRLLFDLDSQHKGLLKLTNLQGAVSTAIFTPEAMEQQLVLERASAWQQAWDYAKNGVWHIWIGFDHILFLLSLLLPAVLLVENRRGHPALRFRAVGVDVLKVVTAFTVAHSITLSLAALQIISLPSRMVESAIALSVILAALNNLFPLFHGRRWLLALGFGLIHGFGFASVLMDLGLPQSALGIALLGFNVGVEGGQMAIVALFLPLAYALRRSRFYQIVLLKGGSIVIVGLAMVWFCERLFDIRLLPT